MQRKLAPVAEAGRPFRHNARELLALSAWRNHDLTNARKYIDMVTSDPESPPNVRGFVQILSALITAAGKN